VKNILNELIRNERGQALVITLGLLIIGGLTITPMLAHTYTGLKAGQIHKEKVDEYYSADAGVELALWNLKSFELEVPEGGQSALPQFTMNAKTVGVTVDNMDGQTYKITSTATSDDGSSTTIESRVRTFAVHAVMSTDPEGLSWVRHDAVINGDVYYAGEYLIEDNAEITGTITQDEPIDLGIDPEEYKAEAQSGGIHVGDLTIDSSPYNLGPLYITGDLKIDDDVDVTLGGTVYVEGRIVIGVKNDAIGVTITGTGNLVAANQDEDDTAIRIWSGVTIDLDNLPLIMAACNSGDIHAHGDSINISGLLYNTGGWVHIHAKAPSSVYGALIGTTVKVCEDTVVTFNPDISELAPYEWSIQGWHVN
jgi:hypothetical protein